MMWRDKGIYHGTVEAVEAWANDKGLIAPGLGLPQANKTLEEATEIRDAIEAEDPDGVADGIGDTLVTLIIQARNQGLTLQDCLDRAYGEIKHRTGQMVNGQFVKDEDLQEGC